MGIRFYIVHIRIQGCLRLFQLSEHCSIVSQNKNHSYPKRANTFSIPVLAYQDGTLAVVDSDITGLVIEINSFDKLLIELPRVADRLLRSNHKLTDEEMAECELQFSLVPLAKPVDETEFAPCPSLPKMSWLTTQSFRPLGYA